MSQIYSVYISSGNSPGPYTIYYNSINDNNIATINLTTLKAVNLTLSQLQNGVNVSVPDDATQIILYNTTCETFKSDETYPIAKEFPCLCFRIFYTNPFDGLTNKEYDFCYNYSTVNGRPQYDNGDCLFLTWKGEYWELEGLNETYKIRAYDFDDIPDTNWTTEGFGAPQSIIKVTQGECVAGVDDYYLVIRPFNPTCDGQTNGSLMATAFGGGGSWVYSLDNLNYSNTTGMFTNMKDGFYTVFAKDSLGNIVSEFFTLSGQPNVNYYINGATSVTELQSGTMRYYRLNVIYDTSQIPVGESVSFDWKLTYNLFYEEPGSANFDTTQHFLELNNVPITISSVSSTSFQNNGISQCNQQYSSYVREFVYQATTITLVKDDIFEANILYGIDTTTGGAFQFPCYTTASVGVNILLENVVETCDCCKLNNNEINIQETVQNYQG